ncbi:MAG: Na+/H+ antiporter [Ginsengibacter sp.]
MHIQEIILFCLVLIFSVCLLVIIARKLKIPYPIFLVIAGLIISIIPGVPAVQIDPDLVFLVILPPILYDAAQNMSLKGLWKWRRIITGMALGFVLFTATAVAFISTWLIPGFTLAQGFLLGAIISPPDAAAASALLQYIRLPKGITTILEGESLLNDATSLTLFRFALAAIVSGNFIWYEAASGFLLVVISGISIGFLYGLLFYAVYKWLPTTSNIDIAISLAIPYVMYITAESIHSSGVLAVVSGGLYIAYQNHFVFSNKSRLKSGAIWSSIAFILNAIVFFILGLQLPAIINGVNSMSKLGAWKIALVVTVAVIVARLVAALFTSVFTRFISRFITVAYNKPGWRNPVVISWAGMRGVVSLASALAIPLMLAGKAFPHRDLILFITFVVIIVTLVVQGLLLPWVIKWIKPEAIPVKKSDDQQILEINLAVNNAGLDELYARYKDDIDSNILLKHKFEFLKRKGELLRRSNEGDGTRKNANEMIQHYKNVMLKVTEKERKKLHAFRRKDDYDDDIIKLIEKRLDLEEETLQEDAE